jgi:hypothetical protein
MINDVVVGVVLELEVMMVLEIVMLVLGSVYPEKGGTD